MSTYVEEIDENLTVHLGPSDAFGAMSVTTATTLTEAPTFDDAWGPTGWGLTLRQNLTVGVTNFGWTFLWGRAISDTVKFGSTPGLNVVYQPVMSDRAKLGDAPSIGFFIPVAIAETMTFAQVTRLALGVTILQRVLFGGSVGAGATYTQRIADYLLLDDALLNFLGGFSNQSFSFHDSFAPTFQLGKMLTENFTLSDALSNNLLWQVTYAEGATIDDGDEAFANMIYGGVFQDVIKLQAGWLDPGEGWTTWAINTRTGAVTEYRGLDTVAGVQYGFNSFARMGDQYLGANEQGLWLLTGATDAGANIVADIRSGILDLGDSHYTMFDGIYLGLRVRDNAKDFLLKIHARGGKTYTFRVRPRDMATTKVNVGKGLRIRYFSWELVTPGPDFDLDSIEFLPLISKRRVS